MAEQDGDLDIGRLVAEHYTAVYGYAFRLCGSVHEAEDLTQQVFLVAQEHLGQVRNLGSVRSWLYTVLRNCFLKTSQRWQPIPAASIQLNIETIPAEDTLGDKDIDQERLQEAMNQLPPVFRVVLVMFYFEGRSYREIAETLELPVGTVMSRLARAKGHLRARLVELECPAARNP